jgi:hypothetical protein
VRLGGTIRTDEQGWTYFALDGKACRIGMHGDGKKVLEIDYEDAAQRLELRQK